MCSCVSCPSLIRTLAKEAAFAIKAPSLKASKSFKTQINIKIGLCVSKIQ